jgi:hypothetical protein
MIGVGLWLYWLLMPLILGADMNPLAPRWPWQLQFEHAELVEEHYAHLVGVLLAAAPLAVICQLWPIRWACAWLLAAGIIAAIPYFLTPQPPYAEEQTWLLFHSVELESLKIALAPLFVYMLLQRVSHFWRRTTK